MPSRRHSAGTTARPHAAGSSASWLPWRLAPQATGSILDRGAVPVAAVVLVVGGLVPADRGVPRPLRTGPREAQQIGAHGTLFLVIDGRYTVPGAICTDDPPSPDQSRPDQPVLRDPRKRWSRVGCGPYQADISPVGWFRQASDGAP